MVQRLQRTDSWGKKMKLMAGLPICGWKVVLANSRWGALKRLATMPCWHGAFLGDVNYSPSVERYGAVGRWARASSQFSYKTPVLGGFSAEIAFITKGDRGNKAKYDLNVIYENGPISAGAAYNKIQDAKANYTLGAKYDFGMFALSAGYYDVRNPKISTLPVGSKAKLAGYSIGGSVKFDNIVLAIELQRQHKSEIHQRNVEIGRAHV